MSQEIITLTDKYRTLKDRVSIGSNNLRPRGEVSIFERHNGKLRSLTDKPNMIVFSGREWLLRRAFGSAWDQNNSDIYDKVIKWFGVGNGGGEAGNPLQAGATAGSDTGLVSPVRLRDDLVITDPGYALYASNYLGDYGYYKTFSSVIIREDRGNPYAVDGVTYYPPLIAEIRIELSSDDANGDSYEDLNEACLFVADPDVTDPGGESSSGGAIGNIDVTKITKDGDYAIYYLDTYDLATDVGTVNVGDYLWVTGATNIGNNITEANERMIVDIYTGEGPAVRQAYVVVENSSAVDETCGASVTGYLVSKTITPYICFSRCSFSSIRKVVDREICFLWRIYF